MNDMDGWAMEADYPISSPIGRLKFGLLDEILKQL